MTFQFPDPNTPPANEPAGAAPASPPAAPANQPPAEETPVHPAWNQALEGMPPLWADRIKAQIRTTETENQRALEQARGASVPDSWKELYDQAEQAGLSPEDFINSYNGQQTLYDQLRTDPDQFLADMKTEIDRQVQAGVLTRAQGRQANADAVAAVAGAGDDLLTPEQIQLQELQQWRQNQEQQQLTAQEQWQAEQVQQIADQEAGSFVDTVHAAFDNDPQLAGAGGVTRQTVAQIAAGLIDADATGRLSYEQAIQGAMNQLRESVGLEQLSFPSQAPSQPGQQQLPNPLAAIGGGTQGFQSQQAASFDIKTPEGRDARDQALVAYIKQNVPQHPENAR